MRTEHLDSNAMAASQREGLERSSADDSTRRALEMLGGVEMGDYRLLDRLGSGGYGEVWKAIGPGELPKAVKILTENATVRTQKQS